MPDFSNKFSYTIVLDRCFIFFLVAALEIFPEKGNLLTSVSGSGTAAWVLGAGVWETTSEMAAESLASSKSFY